MKTALTDRLVAGIAAPASGRSTTWDAKQSGLALRVTPAGFRTFYAVARAPGDKNPSWIRIGSPPGMGVADARRAARAALVALAKAAPKPPPAPPAAPPPMLFAAVAADFVARHVAGLRTAVAYQRRVAKIVAEWGRRPITEITRRDVIGLLEDRVRTLGGNSARHLHSDLAALFGFAADRDLIENSPTFGIRGRRLHGLAKVRERVLTDDELRAVWHAAHAFGGDYGATVQLLLLTGCRRSEIGDLRWSEVDWGRQRIEIPAARMKMAKAHVLPLTPMMTELLQALPRRLHDDRVFRYTWWSREKRRLDQLSGVAGWVLHDIRRSVRTGLAAAGVADAVAERVLAHGPSGIIKTYNRHNYEAEKLAALLLWQERLMIVVGGMAEAA